MALTGTTWIYGRKRLAEVLGMSENTVRRMELEGLPHYKPRGGQVLYDLSEVEDYLRTTRVIRGTLAADIPSRMPEGEEVAAAPRERSNV